METYHHKGTPQRFLPNSSRPRVNEILLCRYAISRYTCLRALSHGDSRVRDSVRNLLQEGVVAKLGNDLYCGGSSPYELLESWTKVLAAFNKKHLRLLVSKTIINPKCTTIHGHRARLRTPNTKSLCYLRVLHQRK